jgi:MFS family permease
MTLPNTTANQIGIFSAIGFFASFLLEIPSGILSDKIGHKKILVIAKILMIFSTLSFIYANSLIYFIFGSIFLSASTAFTSGTQDAFMHNTLIGLKKEKDYVKIIGKIKGNVSLLSIILILALPLFTKISILLPLKISLGFDFFGLVIAFLFITPKEKIEAKDEEPLPVKSQLKELYKTGFFTLSMLFGIFAGIMIASGIYRTVYVESLGFPIIYIGVIMALSRFTWFILGNKLNVIKENFSLKSMMKFEILFFSISLVIASILNNPYLVVIILGVINGYHLARMPIITEHLLKNYCKNKKQKATILSINSQTGAIFQSIITFGIGFFMINSYKIGFFTLGIITFVLSTTAYLFSRKYLN